MKPRAIPRKRKWADMAIDMKIGQVCRLYEIGDVRCLCKALQKRGDKGKIHRDRHGFKVEKVERIE